MDGECEFFVLLSNKENSIPACLCILSDRMIGIKFGWESKKGGRINGRHKGEGRILWLIWCNNTELQRLQFVWVGEGGKWVGVGKN